ncbi:hypothetical protein [Sandaracinobacteroides hominis]|uniref:hypothetical protein n=1 Tax=Sandaracinobacteroides hominis TaxID=2780086 RepID=UPI0018F429BF|nr:hypothetical protein [Sandaracinobacteroides hominis]
MADGFYERTLSNLVGLGPSVSTEVYMHVHLFQEQMIKEAGATRIQIAKVAMVMALLDEDDVDLQFSRLASALNDGLAHLAAEEIFAKKCPDYTHPRMTEWRLRRLRT